MKENCNKILLYCSLILLVGGCKNSDIKTYFFVGNTSKDKKTGHIRVLIDNVEVYSDSIKYYSDSLIKTDDWKHRFEKTLTAKTHRVDVVADNGKITKSMEFKKDSWIYIDYYSYPDGLTINLASSEASPPK